VFPFLTIRQIRSYSKRLAFIFIMIRVITAAKMNGQSAGTQKSARRTNQQNPANAKNKVHTIKSARFSGSFKKCMGRI